MRKIGLNNKKRVSLTVLFSVFFIILGTTPREKEASDWKGKKCAVVLTYDDGLHVHLDKVIPVLDSLGFKGTFYVPGNCESLGKRLDEWKAVADNGHELGNHTLFHPCCGKSKGREWVIPEYDLDGYTVGRIVDEIRLANTLLRSLDGNENRTFAYTCGDNAIGDSVFTDLIRGDFIAARGVTSRMEKLNSIDLFDIGAYGINGEPGEELIERVRQAEETGSLLVFLFHGVGGEHTLNVSLEAHNQLLAYLKESEKNIWVAPMREVAEYVRKN